MVCKVTIIMRNCKIKLKLERIRFIFVRGGRPGAALDGLNGLIDLNDVVIDLDISSLGLSLFRLGISGARERRLIP